jgi:hypothetical protein
MLFRTSPRQAIGGGEAGTIHAHRVLRAAPEQASEIDETRYYTEITEDLESKLITMDRSLILQNTVPGESKPL